MGRLAYSLHRSEDGWSWRVLDARGLTLAAGSEPSQALALQALDSTLRAAAQAALGPSATEGLGG